MTSAPYISVIIPSRARADLLAQCLGSLRANRYVAREIIIVDQSEDRATAQVVQHAAQHDPSLRYVPSDTIGSSRAQNIALELAQGEVLAITNDDCVVDAHWLMRLAQEFRADSQVVGVFGPFLPLSPSHQTVSVAALTGNRRRVQRGLEEIWRLGYGGNMAFRRQRVIEAGGWDELLGPRSPQGWGCNDIDLIYRVLHRGGLAVYAPDIVVWHVQHYDLRQALRREAAYARGAGAIVMKGLRCRDRQAWRLLAQRLWPVGPGRTWSELRTSLSGGNRWITLVRVLFRMYSLVVLIPWGMLRSCLQPITDVEHMLYQSSVSARKDSTDAA
ncbi:Poly-beta-1,6-N-acetyl-D-glucosamine synthase [Thermoflexales bacterium]|nr:Poly-beta-1,6-N-acetyl-D-glucosamine synthase [Thermoflexales bacterium]